jgi:hypothetical protein
MLFPQILHPHIPGCFPITARRPNVRNLFSLVMDPPIEVGEVATNVLGQKSKLNVTTDNVTPKVFCPHCPCSQNC